jgi:hypothetical protein
MGTTIKRILEHTQPPETIQNPMEKATAVTAVDLAKTQIWIPIILSRTIHGCSVVCKKNLIHRMIRIQHCTALLISLKYPEMRVAS